MLTLGVVLETFYCSFQGMKMSFDPLLRIRLNKADFKVLIWVKISICRCTNMVIYKVMLDFTYLKRPRWPNKIGSDFDSW